MVAGAWPTPIASARISEEGVPEPALGVAERIAPRVSALTWNRKTAQIREIYSPRTLGTPVPPRSPGSPRSAVVVLCEVVGRQKKAHRFNSGNASDRDSESPRGRHSSARAPARPMSYHREDSTIIMVRLGYCLNTTIPSGGRLISSDCSNPWLAMASLSAPP